MKSSVIRQIRDIQVQAERLLQNSDLESIEQFERYNQELKGYLINNINEDHILEEIKKISEVEREMERSAGADGLLILIIVYIAPPLASYFRERSYKSRAMEVVRDIRSKYASIEFLLKNYI